MFLRMQAGVAHPFGMSQGISMIVTSEFCCLFSSFLLMELSGYRLKENEALVQ